MPFNRPSLSQIIDRAASDFESRLPGADARLRRSNLAVLGRVHSAAVHGLYGFIAWLALQLMPDTAELEHLARWASIWGVSRKASAKATGNVDFTGVDAVDIPAGTELQRTDGIVYTTDALTTIAAGVATASVTAQTPGVDGAAVAGVKLTFVTPVAGIDGQAVVAAGDLTGGADSETDDSLRSRLLDRIQQPPHGGAHFDYVKWALEIPGVTRAWVSPQELGLGTVTVRFVRDDDASLIPDANEVQAVADYIDPLRPVTAAVTVVAPTAVPMNVTISGLSPDTAEIRAAVEAELTDALRRDAQPGGTILLSHIREAVSIATGENDHVVTAPVANVTHATGEIAVIGAVTWA